jgi:hypothetical protein
MTRPSPRSGAARTGAPPKAALILLVALVMSVAAAACGNTGAVTPTATPSGGVPATPGPKATPWPALVIESVVALGVADAEIWKGGADIARAADAKDVEAMWGAADGLAKLLEELMPSLDALEAYPHTAELGAAYRAAFPVMLEGAEQIRDSITAGDSAGVVAGSQRLAEGVRLYGEVRAILQPYINDALKMKDSLVQ